MQEQDDKGQAAKNHTVKVEKQFHQLETREEEMEHYTFMAQ